MQYRWVFFCIQKCWVSSDLHRVLDLREETQGKTISDSEGKRKVICKDEFSWDLELHMHFTYI